MKHLTEKVSYVRGLIEGLKLDTQSDVGKVLSQMADLLGDMADEVEELQIVQDEMSEFVDSLDETLSEMEQGMVDEDFEDEDFEDEDDADFADEDDFDEDECTGNCDSCAGCAEGEDDGSAYLECMCPSCQSAFYVLESELGDDVFHVCPRCGEKVHVEPDYDEEIPVARLADPELPEE